jgi:hypothetical protein
MFVVQKIQNVLILFAIFQIFLLEQEHMSSGAKKTMSHQDYAVESFFGT